MDRTLTSFIKALRTAEVRVSTAETLDALSAIELSGYRNREFMKNTLSLVLSKTLDEKEIFDNTFEEFFSFDDISSLQEANADAESQSEAEDSFGSSGQLRGTGGRGSPGQAAEDSVSEEESSSQLEQGPIAEASSFLGRLLMADDRVELNMQMSAAAKKVDLENIRVFTQKGLYTRRILEEMGLAQLQKEISTNKVSESLKKRRLAYELKRRLDWLRERVRDYVEKQFLLHADANGMKLREELLRKIKLSNIEHRNFRLVQVIVYRMAKRLVALHSRRKKVYKRGVLNVSRTLRHNMSYDGRIFDLHWKSVKVDRPKVFAICDVSGSVANYARFMLMFLYSLEEVMPKVRSFAFSSDLGEVTEMFERNKLEDAIAKTLRDYGGGSTDYGQALLDFRKKCSDDIDNRTTVIFLGDARNNYGEARQEVLKELYDKSKRVIWLNPESRSTWNSGDAIMRKYSPYVHQVEECNSLMHLERVVSNLLRTVQ